MIIKRHRSLFFSASCAAAALFLSPWTPAPAVTTQVSPSLPAEAAPSEVLEAPPPSDPAAIPHTKLDIPVAWQMTKARLVETGATTLTESYRETWTLEQRPDGAVYLASRRARVPAFLPSGESMKPGSTPTSLTVTDQDLARLVGIWNDAASAEGAVKSPTPVVLRLIRAAKSGTDVTLSWSEDEHFAIHIDVDNATLF